MNMCKLVNYTLKYISLAGTIHVEDNLIHFQLGTQKLRNLYNLRSFEHETHGEGISALLTFHHLP